MRSGRTNRNLDSLPAALHRRLRERTRGHGDASWEDLDADRIGRRCASTHDDPGSQIECCRKALTARDLTEDQLVE